MLVRLSWLCAVLTWSCVVTAPTTKSVDMLMPEVQPQEPDTYLCRSMDVSELKSYITEFIPNANMEIAHHILLHSCEEPGSQAPVWDCGEMHGAKPMYDKGPVCASGARIMYAWAMDAPALHLPSDVAFKVGGKTGAKTLVMQVHYKNVSSFLPPENKKDSSGLTLVTTDEPRDRLAAVYIMVTGGTIPAHSTEYLEAACPFPNTDTEIHPFAFRTHAHKLGRVISGYRVRDGQWTEIGRKDPRKPEMFYNVTNPGMTIKKGDILVSRCTMENTLDHDVSVGNTQKDEMCNFYIMYYVDGKKPLSRDSCYTPGAPDWRLEDYEDQESLHLEAMPDSASTLPDTGKVFPNTVLTDDESPLEPAELDEEEENPEVTEWLDDIIAHMEPEEAETLVSQMLSDQNADPYLAMEPPRQRVLDDAYDRYYFPGGTP